MTDRHGYSGREAAEIAGITYRQLDYWARTDLIRPTLAEARGSGSRRRYDIDDINQLIVVRRMLDAGQHLSRARAVLTHLQALRSPTTALLVITADGVTLADTTDELLAALRRTPGRIISILDLGALAEQTDIHARALTEAAP